MISPPLKMACDVVERNPTVFSRLFLNLTSCLSTLQRSTRSLACSIYTPTSEKIVFKLVFCKIKLGVQPSNAIPMFHLRVTFLASSRFLVV